MRLSPTEGKFLENKDCVSVTLVPQILGLYMDTDYLQHMFVKLTTCILLSLLIVTPQ